MVTRRSLLSLLAAAPLAPVIAHAAPAPRYVGGIAGEAFFRVGVIGENCTESILTPDQARALQLSPFKVDRLVISVSESNSMPWNVPNRLFGATINGDGDAV